MIFRQSASNNCRCSSHVVPACWVELRILAHESHNVLSETLCLLLLCLLFGAVLSETVAFLSMLIAPLLRMKCSNASMGETETIKRYRYQLRLRQLCWEERSRSSLKGCS